MTNLSHSEAHEQLEDLALEPAALERLARALETPSGAASLDPLAAHVRTCRPCQAEIRDWQRVHDHVAVALSGGDAPLQLADLAREEPVSAPARLRDAVAAIAAPGRAGDSGEAAPQSIRPAGGRGRPFPGMRIGSRLLPLVAVLAVVAVAGGILIDQSRRLDRATADAAALAAVATTLDRVILDPDHRALELQTANGQPGGSIVWTSHDLVVLTTALSAPPADVVYRCWVERDGQRSPIGRMFFAGGTGYWTGSLEAWATTSFEAGSTFGISLEPRAGSTGAPAVLEARFGS